MRTLVKHGLLAASVAALALACGSGNKSSREPAASTENTQAAYTPQQQSSYGQTSTSTSSTAMGGTQGQDMNQGQGTMGSDNSGSTLGSGGPQKPFYGPGLTNPNDQASTTTTNEGSMAAKQVTNLSDGDIYAIEDAANNGEIQMAEIARKSAQTAQVKDFAAMMITHHRDAENKLKSIAKKSNITSKDNDVSNKLKNDVQAMLTELRAKKGREFDRLYMDDQVTAHRQVLDIVDNQLLPSAQNTDLKSHLSEVRRTVADHLQKAEDIQSKMQPVSASESISGGSAKGKTSTTTTTGATMKGKGDTSKSGTKSGGTKSGGTKSNDTDPDHDGDVHDTK